jgi:hypothetical protein
VIQAEAGQAFRHETVLARGRVAEEGGIAVRETVIHAARSLVVGHAFLARVQIIVGIVARADHGGLAHHGLAAHVCSIRQRRVLIQHDRGSWRQPSRWNHIQHAVVLKLLTDVLRIRRAHWQAWVVVRVIRGGGGGRVVDIHAALPEVAGVLGSGGHGVHHGVDLNVPQGFIVQKEEGPAGVLYGAAERRAKVVLHQEI